MLVHLPNLTGSISCMLISKVDLMPHFIAVMVNLQRVVSLSKLGLRTTFQWPFFLLLRRELRSLTFSFSCQTTSCKMEYTTYLILFTKRPRNWILHTDFSKYYAKKKGNSKEDTTVAFSCRFTLRYWPC